MPCNIPREHGSCQFNMPEEEIYQIDDERNRCIFHLGGARNLTEEEALNFNVKMREYVHHCFDAGEPVNLLNVHFHQEFPPEFFRGHSFNNGIKLVRVAFANDIDFSGCHFGRGSSFSEINSPNKANFAGATFIGDTWFRKVSFRGTNFSGCRFGGSLVLDMTFYGSRCWFDKIVVHGDTYIANATFGPVTFIGARFEKQASFDRTEFTCGVSFDHTTFIGHAVFVGNEDNRKLEMASTSANHFISFSSATFMSTCNFNNRRFGNATLFRKTVFHKAPTFTNAILHDETTFAGATFLDHHPHMRNRYGVLKRAMETIRNRYDEGLFYAQEQKCLRNDDTVAKTAKVFSWLYEKLSNYGQSIVRPLFGIFYIWLGAGAIYSLLASPTINPRNSFDVSLVLQAFRFSLDQIVQPFSASKIEEHPIWVHGYWGLIEFIANVESVLSLAFLSFLLIAMRWWFKRS